MTASARITPLGESALLITFADVISREVAERVLAVAERVTNAAIVGVTDVVPAYTTLAVYYDAPLTYAVLHARMAPLMDDGGARQSAHANTVTIPVQYDGEDLAWVAEQAGLTVAEVIARHSQVTYLVYMLGFVPGFAYLGDLDPSLVLPRRATPRQRVPRGSVAIAGAQTAVYPLETPGGWHLIGRTPLTMFDARRDPATLLRPGDAVRFAPIEGEAS